MNARDHLRARPAPAEIAAVVAALVRDFGPRAQTAAAIREQHGHGEALADPALPDVVVYPRDDAEVAAIVGPYTVILLSALGGAAWSASVVTVNCTR